MDCARILYSEISFKPAIPTPPKQQQQQSTSATTTTSTSKSTNSNSNSLNTPSIHHNNNNNINSNSNNNNNNKSEQLVTPPTKLNQLCDPKLVQLDWLQSEKIGGGLINVGNTCFLNSVLQCLTYCPPLYNFLVKLNGGHSKSCKINQFCMLCEMEKHVKRIKGSNGGSIKPMSIVQRLKYINKSFQFGRQEDAHEFLRYLIDHMWKACLMNLDINVNNNNSNKLSSNNNNIINSKLDPRVKETTLINHIFGGYHRSQVLCLTCNTRSNTFDFFMDIILDIRNAKSLEEALKRFTQQETLENENAYKCGVCRKKVTARKKFTVYKEPNVATFQLKRFDSDRIFGGKIIKFISYPEELDLRPYMSDPTKSSMKYQLSAVLVHVGHSTNSGHYFCYIKNSNNFWYRMDDSNVSLVSINTVLAQQAYVLFYTKKPTIEQRPQHQQPHPSNGISTWLGSKSKLEENEAKNNNDMSERDKFNEELDRGKIKKFKRSADDNFNNNNNNSNNNNNHNNHNHNNHSKANPFQEFTNNGFHTSSQTSNSWFNNKRIRYKKFFDKNHVNRRFNN